MRRLAFDVYFMPPYVMTTDELRQVIRVAVMAVEEACAAPALGRDDSFNLP